MSPHRPTRAAGFTLLELMIVLAILAPVLGVVVSGVSTVVETSVDAAVQVEAQRKVIFTTKMLRKELRRAQIESVSPDGLSISYRHPLDMAGNGTFIDALGTVQWGAIEPLGPDTTSWYTIRFVADGTVEEAIVSRDLNQDGDTTDTFEIGHLERGTPLSTSRLISPSVYLVDAADPRADLNGDGEADPMFSWTLGEPVTIRLLTRVQRKDSPFGSTFNRKQIFLSNMAESQ